MTNLLIDFKRVRDRLAACCIRCRRHLYSYCVRKFAAFYMRFAVFAQMPSLLIVLIAFFAHAS